MSFRQSRTPPPLCVQLNKPFFAKSAREEIVIFSPVGQALYFLQIGLFIVFSDQTHQTQLSSHQGTLVLMLRVDDVCSPTSTTRGLPVRKSRIYTHSKMLIAGL